MQKTWMDLLGPSAERCKVRGREIVRNDGRRRFCILHVCASVEQAREVFKQWQHELAQADSEASE